MNQSLSFALYRTYAVPSIGHLLSETALGVGYHSMVFGNSKLRRVVPGYRAEIPFEQGAREIVAW